MRFTQSLRSASLLFLLVHTAAAADRNIVLFVADDLGQDAGCYGNSAIRTPHLDALAADGTRFEYAFATTASCSPSRSVILTGLHNHANGMYGLAHARHKFTSLPDVKTLPVMLAGAGYHTVRIGKYHVAPEPTYHFETSLRGNARSPVQMAQSCRRFLQEQADAEDERPFFLLFCTSDPHRSRAAEDLPHQPDRFGNQPDGYPGITPVAYEPEDVLVPPCLPDTPACRAELAQYYQSVSRLDQGLGHLVNVLKETGHWENTLFVFISDHGIPFHGAKTTVYEPGLRSPCVVRNPYERQRGIVTDAMVSWADLTPTLLEFAGVAPDGVRFHGRSFMPVLAQTKTQGWDEVFASHTFHEVTMYYPMRVVRERRYKLIWNIAHELPFPSASDLWNSATWQTQLRRGPEAPYGRRTVSTYLHRPEFELYDLCDDPYETANLAMLPEHSATLARLKAKLRRFQEVTDDPWILKWDRE